MSYIISKLDVRNLRMSILYSSDNESDCKAKLLDLIKANDNINKVIENDYIKSFSIDKGYLYNSKYLKGIYQILKVKKNKDNNDDKDDEIDSDEE